MAFRKFWDVFLWFLVVCNVLAIGLDISSGSYWVIPINLLGAGSCTYSALRPWEAR